MADEVQRVCGVVEGNTAICLSVGGVNWSIFLLCGMIPVSQMEQGGTMSRCNRVREAFNHISVENLLAKDKYWLPWCKIYGPVFHLPAYIPSPVGVRCWTAQQPV